MLPPRANDSFVAAIAARIRSVTARQQGHAFDALAVVLSVDGPAFCALIDEHERAIDVAFLIDVVSALVREFAVDPHWLLSGQYDSRAHRQALLLGADRSTAGADALRKFIRQRYDRLRDPVSMFPFAELDEHVE